MSTSGVGATDHGDKVRMALAPDPHALAEARRFLALYAQGSGLDEDSCDEVVQAAAELMALGRGRRRVLAVAVEEHEDRLTVLVDLAGPGAVYTSDEAASLLCRLSREWGWRRLPGCTQAWCDVLTHQSET